MHRPRFASPTVLLICFLAPGAAADEPGLKLKIQPVLIPYSEHSGEPTVEDKDIKQKHSA